MKDVNGGINRYLESLEDNSDIGMQYGGNAESASVKLGNIVLLTRSIPLIVRTLATTVDKILKVPQGSLKADSAAKKPMLTYPPTIPPDIIIDSSHQPHFQNNGQGFNNEDNTQNVSNQGVKTPAPPVENLGRNFYNPPGTSSMDATQYGQDVKAKSVSDKQQPFNECEITSRKLEDSAFGQHDSSMQLIDTPDVSRDHNNQTRFFLSSNSPSSNPPATQENNEKITSHGHVTTSPDTVFFDQSLSDNHRPHTENCSPNQHSFKIPPKPNSPTAAVQCNNRAVQPDVNLLLNADDSEPPLLPPKLNNYQNSDRNSAFDSDPRCKLQSSSGDNKTQPHLRYSAINSRMVKCSNDLGRKSSKSRSTQLVSNEAMFIDSPPMMRKQRSGSYGHSGSFHVRQHSNSNQQLEKDGTIGVDRGISTSDLVTPDIRVASGVSLSVQTELEELRRQADSHSVSTYDDVSALLNNLEIPSPADHAGRYTMWTGRHTNIQTEAGMNKEQFGHPGVPNNRSPVTRGTLANLDMQLLLYYSNQISQHWSVIDNAASVFFRSIEGRPSPKLFVTHSQFIILGGRKMTYLGELLARGLSEMGASWEMEQDSSGSKNARELVESYSNKLCEALKESVIATRDAALEYPSVSHVQHMVDAIKDVTDWALNLKDIVFRLAYLSTGK